ncbi:MAG: insulinase family protein [Acidobacteriota bacterium]|nr:insulinase family protein [Acidobacteriota bacterium]
MTMLRCVVLQKEITNHPKFSMSTLREESHQPVRRTKLANGTIVLTEHMLGLRSATIGVWVRRGSRHETPALNGICHFIEHAVFKGTRRRTALDIAIESDRLGGHFDAYTTQEMTGFALKVVDAALPQAFDLLADMLLAPRFDADDLAREQKVIIEEIKMVEDSPEELLGELFNSAYFPEHPLGLPIEGTPETVATFDRTTTANFHAHAYAPRNLVIAAAGNVQHEQLLELCERAFVAAATPTALDQQHSQETPLVPPRAAAPLFVQHKPELEQAHLILATPWPSARDEDRYAASLLASVLGGGTSSRLWQAIREERGLAYSVGAAASGYHDTGVFHIYAGTSPEQADEVLDLALAELRRVLREPIGAEELQLVKDQAVASILLNLESTSARAGTLARQEMTHGRRITPDEIIRRLEAVTAADLQRVARARFQTESLAFGALGDLDGFMVDRERLEI